MACSSQFQSIGYRSVQSPCLIDGIRHLHEVHCLSSLHLIHGKSDTPQTGRSSRPPRYNARHALRTTAASATGKSHCRHEQRSPPAASAPAVPSPATTGLPKRDAPDRSRSGASSSPAGADRRTPTTASSNNYRSRRERTALPARRATAWPWHRHPEPDAVARRRMRLHELLEQRLMRRRRPVRTLFQAAQRRRARLGLRPGGRRLQDRIVMQLLVIVQVLMPQSQCIHALPEQIFQTMRANWPDAVHPQSTSRPSASDPSAGPPPQAAEYPRYR